MEAAIAAVGERKQADAATISMLREQLEAERSRAERAEQALAAERARIDVIRDRWDAMQIERDQARREAREAWDRADAAEARGDRAVAALAAERAAIRSASALDLAPFTTPPTQDGAEAKAGTETKRRARGLVSRLRAVWQREAVGQSLSS